MTPPPPFAQPDPADVRLLAKWLQLYTTRPHPHLGRPGPVCPFTTAMTRANSLVPYTYPWPGDGDLPVLIHALRAALELFPTLPWPDGARDLRVLAVLVPGLPPSQWHLSDEAQRAVQHQALHNGLMIGQFHPACPEPGVHNPGFPAHRSPLPTFAIRHMTLHDVRFLHRDPRSFAAYRQRFAHHHTAAARQKHPELTALYHQALSRHTTQTGGAP